MRPSSDDLFFERFLLTEGAGWQQGQSQHRDCRDAENTTPVHWFPPLSRLLPVREAACGSAMRMPSCFKGSSPQVRRLFGVVKGDDDLASGRLHRVSMFQMGHEPKNSM